MVVLPSGAVSACFEVHDTRHPLAKDLIIGSLQDGHLRLDEERWRMIVSRTVDKISYCNDCFCKYSCAGDCIGKTFASDTIGNFQSSPRCRLNRELTKHLLLSSIAASDGVWIGELEEPEADEYE
jgi:uncharacterized protein